MGDTVSLSALFVSAFTSATLLPGTSDAALVAVLWRNPALAWQALAVATLGNSLGGMLSYGLGRLLPEKIRHRFSEKPCNIVSAGARPYCCCRGCRCWATRCRLPPAGCV